MKKISLYLLIGILLIGIANAIFSYQENADSYSYEDHITYPTDAYDGDWSTAAFGVDGYDRSIYMNYSKSINASNSTLWQVKFGISSTLLNISLVNCWNLSNLQLRAYFVDDTDIIRVYCWNGTWWKELANSGTGSIFYEEGVWWDNVVYIYHFINTTFINNSQLTKNIHILNFSSDVYGNTNTTINLSIFKLNGTIRSQILNNTVYNNIDAYTSYYQINYTNNIIQLSNYTAGDYEIFITAEDKINYSFTTLSRYFTIVLNYTDILYKCAGIAGSVEVYNISLKDEDNFTNINGDISADLTYGNNQILSFQINNSNSLALCANETTNFSISGVFITNTGYLNKYYIQDVLISNVTTYLTLYNFKYPASISTLQWSLKDYTWASYANSIGIMERYYPTLHTWNVVQMDKSGEFGNLYYNIYETTVDYRFKFYDSTLSNLLYETQSLKFICTSGYCSATTQIVPSETEPVNINPTESFNSNTSILTVSWNDPTGDTQWVNVLVEKVTMSQSTLICDYTTYSTSGSYSCNTTGYSGTAMVTVTRKNSHATLIQKVTQELSHLPLIGGGAGVLDKYDLSFWAFGITLTLVGLSVFVSPLAVIIMFFSSLVFMSIIGFFDLLSLGFLGIVGILSILIAIKVRQ